jgi:hypothetical protein
MNKIGLLTTLIALAIALPMEAGAKGRVRSSHSHASPEAHPHATGETHPAEGGSGIIRNAVARPHRSQDGTTGSENGALPGTAPGSEEDANLRRIREEKAAARAKRDAEILAARKLQQEADAEKRREQAEQAALNASEAEKRKEAEARAKNRELALLERQQRQAAWEARCQIKPVMTDAEIATCKEVWSTAAR